ncbi:MAG TPA: NfeD family protein [Bacteroidales bacterium]
MDIIIIVVLAVIAVLLFLLEVFFLPGITIAGFGGLLFAAGAVYEAYIMMGTSAAVFTLLGMALLFVICFIIFLKSGTWNKIALNTDINSKVENNVSKINIGDTGKTSTRLGPMGHVVINGVTVEAKAEDEIIDANEEIIVTELHANNITVKKKEVTSV